jgi:hypothetical protein
MSNNTQFLVIADTLIHQDAEGRYCLNDFHKAAGGEAKNKPSEWLRNKQTTDLIEEISKAGIPALDAGIPASIIQPVMTINGGNQPGTYVVKELVYAYAMWISPAFSLKVIRAYDALMTGGYSSQDYLALQAKYVNLMEERIRYLDAQRTRFNPRTATPDEVAAISRCIAEGFSYIDIGKLLKRSRHSVRHIYERAVVGAGHAY